MVFDGRGLSVCRLGAARGGVDIANTGAVGACGGAGGNGGVAGRQTAGLVAAVR